MAVTLSAFRDMHPEFQNVPDALCQACLDEALASLNATRWGTMIDIGQRYLAAHRIALSPYGQGTRLVTSKETTTYGTHYEDLVRQISEGVAVL